MKKEGGSKKERGEAIEWNHIVRRGSKKDTHIFVAVSGQLFRYSRSILVYDINVTCIMSVGWRIIYSFANRCDFIFASTTSRGQL